MFIIWGGRLMTKGVVSNVFRSESSFIYCFDTISKYSMDWSRFKSAKKTHPIHVIRWDKST